MALYRAYLQYRFVEPADKIGSTVQPLLSGHPRDFENGRLIEVGHLIEVKYIINI